MQTLKTEYAPMKKPENLELNLQSMLMLTELPEMVTVFEQFFQLEYSESYNVCL